MSEMILYFAGFGGCLFTIIVWDKRKDILFRDNVWKSFKDGPIYIIVPSIIWRISIISARLVILLIINWLIGSMFFLFGMSTIHIIASAILI